MTVETNGPLSKITLSWDHCRSKGKMKTMFMQNFGGQTKSIMVLLKVVYYAIVIAKLSDWVKNLAPVFEPKPIAPRTRDFSRASSKLQVTARNSEWLIAMFAPVAIGRSNYCGIGFSPVI